LHSLTPYSLLYHNILTFIHYPQRSAKTRSRDRADEIRRSLERELGLMALQKQAGNDELRLSPTLAKLEATEGPVTLASVVARFLAAKKKENLAEATIYKLTTIFENRCSRGLVPVASPAWRRSGAPELETLRETWKDEPLARKKKQGRIIGFSSTGSVWVGSNQIQPE
jgi:hypothetical protein